MPTLRSTVGCTTPAPETSSQPVCLQTRQPAPLQNTHSMSTSADGSVNGKYDGRSRILSGRSKKPFDELVQHRLHVGEAHALVDDQPLELVEHRRVRHVGVAAIDAARRNHAQRRLVAHHGADLHGRRVRAQQPPVREVERVVHRARRMIRRDIERLEVVPVVLDLGTALDGEAGAAEQLLDTASCARQRMQRAVALAAPRLRHVDAGCRELALERDALELGASRLGERDQLVVYARSRAHPRSCARRVTSAPSALRCAVIAPFLPRNSTLNCSRSASESVPAMTARARDAVESRSGSVSVISG